MNLNLLADLNCEAAKIAFESAAQAALGVKKIDVDDDGKSYGGASVFDFAGTDHGTIAAGIRLSEICMSGLGQVSLHPANGGLNFVPQICVTTDHPLFACIASQYAGWPLSENRFFAMCSGPARSIAGKEDILQQYNLQHDAGQAVGVLETNRIPPQKLVRDFADACSVDLKDVVLCLAATSSLPGSVQIVSRSIETAMHKLHELQFDLRTVKSGFGSAPLPPITNNDLQALGRTNDAILYGGTVNLYVDTTDDAIEQVISAVPSCSSANFGTPFLEVFNRFDQDFYKIDPLLFSPAKIIINNLSTGRVFESGEVRTDILKASFGISGTTPSLDSPHTGDA